MPESRSEQIHPWSDAWLLLAAGYRPAVERVSLAGLIAAADMLQYAMPAFEEVDGGLARLAAAGLLTVDHGTIRVTSAGHDLLARAAGNGGAVSQWESGVERELPAAAWSSTYHPTQARRASTVPAMITREEYDAVVERYAPQRRKLP